MRIDELRKKYRDMILRIAARNQAEDVRVFGSMARGETAPRDIDFLVRFKPGASLLDEAALDRELKELLGQPVDVIGEDVIRDEFRPFILSEAVPL